MKINFNKVSTIEDITIKLILRLADKYDIKGIFNIEKNIFAMHKYEKYLADSNLLGGIFNFSIS